MKNWIVLLVFLSKVCLLPAQYTVSSTLQAGSNPPVFLCTIVPNATSTDPQFAMYDLITWIFPDGQFIQNEIDQSGINSNSNQVSWQPYTDAPSGPNNIIAYVAKKGKPGNPSRITDSKPITGTFTGSPALFALQSGKRWQVNRSWEFAPDHETFLIVSYILPLVPACDLSGSNQITLTYQSGELTMMGTENLAYQSENAIETSVSSTENMILINNLKLNNTINHVYVKLKTNSAVREGQTMNVKIGGSICGEPINETIQLFAKGGPHDPNEKLVNHLIICDSQPDRTDLSYYIRFQNDGNAPVDSVDVEDDLVPELDKATLTLADVPNFPAVYIRSDTTVNSFRISFKNLNLPGLKQTNPHYAYDQTCYAFTYNVCTKPVLATNLFYNSAKVYFHDPATKTILPPVATTYALTLVTDTSCYKPQISCTVPTIEQASIINSVSIFPNPFGERIQISLDLEEKTRLFVIVKDLNGRFIDQIANSEYTSGAHQINWNSARIPTGVYLLEIQTERGRIARKIIKM